MNTYEALARARKSLAAIFGMRKDRAQRGVSNHFGLRDLLSPEDAKRLS
jgi:hypothetical protein